MSARPRARAVYGSGPKMTLSKNRGTANDGCRDKRTTTVLPTAPPGTQNTTDRRTRLYVQIFSKYRPYDNMNDSMRYNVGQYFQSWPQEPDAPDKIALILMNDTFPEVTYFPKIFYFQPLPITTTLTCTILGFSLLGRNLTAPILKPVGPMMSSFKAHLSMKSCQIP